MPGFHHAADARKEVASPRRTRLGLKLFAIYLALYAGFMLMNAITPQLMERTPFAGINIAVLYGLGLIFAAFLMAIVYELLCRRIDRQDSQSGGDAP